MARTDQYSAMPAPLPTIQLVPLTEDEFATFGAEAVVEHAQDNVKAGKWTMDEALAQSREEFARLLPQGLRTPGHRLFGVHEAAQGDLVGYLWFAVSGEGAARGAYLYNVQVRSACRGRGYAKAALDHFEALAAADGATHVRLHVFSFNSPAQALYRSQGYWITGLNMHKKLGDEGVDSGW